MKHYIFLSSSYKTFERICYHIPIEKEKDMLKVDNIRETLKEANLSFRWSIYCLSANGNTFEDVKETDRFYLDVRKIEDINDFICLIKQSMSLETLDVAKYILSVKPITLNNLQQILYLSFEQYLKATGKKMFKEEYVLDNDFVIFKSIDNYFSKYRKRNNEKINEKYEEVAKSARIYFADDGFAIKKCIDDVLKNFSSYSSQFFLKENFKK